MREKKCGFFFLKKKKERKKISGIRKLLTDSFIITRYLGNYYLTDRVLRLAGSAGINSSCDQTL